MDFDAKAFVDRVLALAPQGTESQVDKPEKPTGHWFIDFKLGEFTVVVQWMHDKGFGMSGFGPSKYPLEGFGEGPDEVHTDQDIIIRRVSELLHGRINTGRSE